MYIELVFAFTLEMDTLQCD